jgi:hypothetical protein
MRERKGLTDRLMRTGTRLVTRAAETVLRDPRGQEAVARALGVAQRGRKRIEDLQARAMKIAGVPGRQEYQDLARQLARIKRKARELNEKLGSGGAVAVAGEAEDPSSDEGSGASGPR